MSGEIRIAEDTLTYSDYCELPDNGQRYEIIDGELYNAPAPYVRHQIVLRNLVDILSPYCSRRNHGMLLFAPTDIILSNIDIVQPDILWISNERKLIITEKNIQGAPDLVIEITGKFTGRKDAIIKKKLYGRFGVREYWLVDPNKKSVQIFRKRGRGLSPVETYRGKSDYSSTLFPGLIIELKEVFMS